VAYRDLAAMSSDPRDRAVSGGHSMVDFAGMVAVACTSASRAGSSTSRKVLLGWLAGGGIMMTAGKQTQAVARGR
jgi:hypothetical protein